MIPNKRLQVFISSTYQDLIDERQAAVQAILASGHIPAGMELFSASDQSQLNVIKNWIQQSDVFLLILGGRYGSIEPITGKSYTQLEYEYAVSLNKPLFSVVLSDKKLEEKVKKEGTKAIEIEYQFELKEFKKAVLSKLVKFWDDVKDIKLAIYETLSDFSSREELVGWIPANQKVDTSRLAEELARMGKENALANTKISELLEEKSRLEKNQKTIALKNLGEKRRGISQTAKLGGQSLIIRTSEFHDGTLGEIAIELSKQGTTTQGLMNCFSIAVSIGLQYGVPLEVFVENFVYVKFEPSGMTEHPNVKTSTSIVDFIFRILGYEYLHRTDLVHVLDRYDLSDDKIEVIED